MNEEKKDSYLVESDEYERFVNALQRKIDKHEKSIEKQTKIEEKIESDKETYTKVIEYINEMWETELKSITYSKLDKPQRKEYRYFKKKWKELHCDLNWYDREIKYCTNNFLETLGQKNTSDGESIRFQIIWDLFLRIIMALLKHRINARFRRNIRAVYLNLFSFFLFLPLN